MCNVVLKSKDLCYWQSGHGPVFAGHDPVVNCQCRKLTEGEHGGVLVRHGPVSGKELQVSNQTAGLGDEHGGVSAGHVPVWTVCESEKQVLSLGSSILGLQVLRFSTLTLALYLFHHLIPHQANIKHPTLP